MTLSSDPIVPPPAPPMFELFWEEHRQTVTIALFAAVVFALAAVGIIFWNHSRTLAAEALFFEATDINSWEKVVKRYPRSLAAANALLLMAQAEAQKKNNTAASKIYTQFLEQFPHHPLAVNALLGKAMNDDVMANPQAAADAFQQAASAYPQSYGAPFALMMEARLLLRLGKKEEAKRVLQMLSNQFPESLVNRVMLRREMVNTP